MLSDAKLTYQLISSSFKFLEIKNITPASMIANNLINLMGDELQW
jgi:hypothetical protein